MIVGGSQGNQGEEKAEGQGAGVAHKDFSGREVEYEEAQQRANENQGNCADEDLAACGGGGKEDGSNDYGDAGGGAIHIIEKVKDVDDKDNPDGGEDGGYEFAVDEEFEADVGEKRGGGSDGELNSEFQKWAETFFVVDESQRKQREDADEDDDELIYFADEAGGVNGDGFVEPGESAR